MTVTFRIRSAQPKDAGALLAIYAPFVLHTTVSFEMEVPSEADFYQRVEAVQRESFWLVCELDGAPVGYAYAAPHRSRAAYRWTREVSAYVREGHRGRGIGTALYTTLHQLLRLQGYTNALAGIALPNAASVALHEKMGYTPVGTYHRVGFKFGKFHDVGWWEKPLSALPPGEIKAPDEVLRSAAGRAAVGEGLTLLRGDRLLG